ncbi:MAG: hypothetical protein GC155_11620 [Alphaproteobacteria bacterium]|nr:hypothetical protein [Alphaproteobacteria bacterium]
MRRALISGLAALILTGPAFAQRHFQAQQNWNPQESRGHDRDRRDRGDRGQGDQQRAQQREVSLSEILRRLQSQYGGQHLDARREGDRYVISWITGEGRRLVIEVDAATGRTISVRG